MPLQVQAPTRRPRQGGLKSIVGEFVSEPRLAAVNQAGGLAWEDSGCGFPKQTRAGCYDDVVAAADKTADGITQFTTIGDPFAGYAGVECLIGGDAIGPSYEEQALTLLEQGEDRYVEAQLWAWAAAAPTPGTATSIADGIGVAEEWADTHYVGAPIILMSRRAADIAHTNGTILREGGKLVTANGSWVLATGVAPTGDEMKIIAIGGTAVYASAIVSRMAMAHTDNLAMAIAERVYALGVDCDFRYAVAVTTP